ncbi:MAG: hypothetical protein WDZ29_06075 [Balneolaceae bacterium]
MSKMIQKFALFALLFASSLTLFQACEEDPLSDELDGLDEAPAVPTLEAIDLDFSYFEENQIPSEPENPEDFSVYMQAQSMVMEMGMGMDDEVLMIPSIFLSLTSGSDAEQQGNSWVWSFSGDVPDEETESTIDFEATVTATPGPGTGQFTWEFLVTAEDHDFGSIEDFVLLSGVVSEDHLTGQFDFFIPDPEQPEGIPFIEMEWDASQTNSTSFSILVSEIDEEFGEAWQFSLEYDQSGPEHNFSFQEAYYWDDEEYAARAALDYDNQEENSFGLYWNTDTGVGYMLDWYGVTCWWGDDLRMTECDEQQQQQNGAEMTREPATNRLVPKFSQFR